MPNVAILKDIANLLLAILVFLCLFICNIFFVLFRTYQANLPYPHPQHLIINILFAHLSVIWQAANILCCSSILYYCILDLHIPWLACILFYCRLIQIHSSSLHVVFLSFARFFAHFWTTAYFDLPHMKLAKISIWVTALVSVSFTLVVWLAFTNRTVYPEYTEDKKNLERGTETFVLVSIVPVTFFNGSIILDRLVQKKDSVLAVLGKFLRNNSVSPEPSTEGIQTISHTVAQGCIFFHNTPSPPPLPRTDKTQHGMKFFNYGSLEV